MEPGVVAGIASGAAALCSMGTLTFVYFSVIRKGPKTTKTSTRIYHLPNPATEMRGVRQQDTARHQPRNIPAPTAPSRDPYTSPGPSPTGSAIPLMPIALLSGTQAQASSFEQLPETPSPHTAFSWASRPSSMHYRPDTSRPATPYSMLEGNSHTAETANQARGSSLAHQSLFYSTNHGIAAELPASPVKH